jgi:hypothetical protein
MLRIPPFPVGSEVQLSTGETAMVIENKVMSMQRPKVRIIKDAKGKVLHRGEMKDIKLVDEPDIHIIPPGDDSNKIAVTR